MQPVIHCRTLGPAKVCLNDEPAPQPLTWRKHLALLIYLARSPHRRRSRDHLLALLWPEKPEAAARHSLNEAIRVIRRTAGDESIVSQAEQIRLSPASVVLDVDEMEQRVAAQDWMNAAALVRGEFLESFTIPDSSAFEEWLEAERRHWRRLSLRALLCSAEDLLSQGKPEEAVQQADRARELEPSSEGATSIAMRGLALSGNHAAALERYDDLVTCRLNEGAETGAELRALAGRLRGRRSSPPVPLSASGAARPSPLHGREGELAALVAVWRRCRSEGRAGAAVIVGDAGTGKSRLIEELVLRVGLEGDSVAQVRAVESDLNEKWSGLRALGASGMVGFPGVAGCAEDVLASLGTFLGEWAERFPSARPSREIPLGPALGEVLRITSQERPVLLVLDDSQWLDRESLLAVHSLLRDLRDRPVMLIIAASGYPARVEVESLMEDVGRDVPGRVLKLAPLSAEAMHQLARWWLPQFAEDEIERVTRRVTADSAGLPLLAVELFRAVALGLDLLKLEAWPQPTRTLDQTLPGDLAPSVVAAVRVAYRRVSKAGQQVLAAASVLPEPATADLLSRAAALSVEETHQALDELEWHRWVTAGPRGYAFVARLVREIIARDMLTEGQRQRIRTL